MRFLAVAGQGCDHCEVGAPIEEIMSRAGHIRLCLECVLLWFPGRSVAWWEERHAPFRDHLGDKIRAARERELEALWKIVGTDSREPKRSGKRGTWRGMGPRKLPQGVLV